MFEIGRRYRIVTQNHEGECTTIAIVSEFEFPLLKIERPGSYEILNVASPAFVSATPNDKAAEESQKEAHKEFMETLDIRLSDKGGKQ